MGAFEKLPMSNTIVEMVSHMDFYISSLNSEAKVIFILSVGRKSLLCHVCNEGRKETYVLQEFHASEHLSTK